MLEGKENGRSHLAGLSYEESQGLSGLQAFGAFKFKWPRLVGSYINQVTSAHTHTRTHT